jgi:hypothetical protein
MAGHAMAESLSPVSTAVSQRRRSDRVRLNLPVKLEGKDSAGHKIEDFASATNLSRGGGTLVTKHVLAPGSTVFLANSGTNQEVSAVIVGQVGLRQQAHLYGIKFLQDKERFWGISFPPISDDADFIAKVLLECSQCTQREVAALSEVELEVFEINDRVSRNCSECHHWTTWKRAEFENGEPTSEPSADSDTPKVTVNRRKNPRVKVSMKGCVLHNHDTEIPVNVLDMSRGGIKFISEHDHKVGDWVQVAVPYIKGSANIFESGRIVRRKALDGGKGIEYGLKYVKA